MSRWLAVNKQRNERFFFGNFKARPTTEIKYQQFYTAFKHGILSAIELTLFTVSRFKILEKQYLSTGRHSRYWLFSL